MKKIKYISCLILLAGLIGVACEKIPVGFISETMYYKDSPFKVAQGEVKQTTNALNLDGSTLPATVTLLEVRKKGTNERAEEFYKNHEVYIYNRPIDPSVDTTLAQINSKREKKSIPPFEFLPSGQFIFNAGTSFLPVGSEYEFDVQVNNESGSKTFKNIGQIHITEPEVYKIEAIACNWFRDNSTANAGWQTPTMTITKVSAEGTKVILRIVDKNGVPFNPKKGEIIKRGDRPTFETYARFNPVEVTDTEMICDYAIAPFPFVRIPVYGLLIYYRIPSDYANFDTYPDSSPGGTFSVNPRMAFQIKQEGTYIVEVKLNGVTHK